jgi:hypothetical protein
MQANYHISSPAAIAGGVVASGGAMALLVRDAWITGWTVDLALMPALVGLTILAGHLLWTALRHGRAFSVVGLALLSILGSALVVYETAGRRGEVRDVKTAGVAGTEAKRSELQQRLREAEEILATHRKAASAECASGVKKRCEGMTYTVSTWESAVTGYETKIGKLPPPSPVDPKAARIAAVLDLAGVTVKPEAVKRAVATLEPFALPLFLELGSIVLFSFGISQRQRKVAMVAIPTIPAKMVAPAAPKAPPVAETKETVAQSSTGMTKIEAERDLVTLLALGKPIPSQDWLVERWDMEGKKGTISKWVADWEADGIITRTQVGARKVIGAA